jgi:hypothetical protein
MPGRGNTGSPSPVRAASRRTRRRSGRRARARGSRGRSRRVCEESWSRECCGRARRTDADPSSHCRWPLVVRVQVAPKVVTGCHLGQLLGTGARAKLLAANRCDGIAPSRPRRCRESVARRLRRPRSEVPLPRTGSGHARRRSAPGTRPNTWVSAADVLRGGSCSRRAAACCPSGQGRPALGPSGAPLRAGGRCAAACRCPTAHSAPYATTPLRRTRRAG